MTDWRYPDVLSEPAARPGLRLFVTSLAGRAAQAVGGGQRLRVIAVLAGLLGLDGAARATVAVNTTGLEKAFGIDHPASGCWSP